jgi:hypothetical protein
MRCEGLPSDEDHCRFHELQCCGHVQQCIGRMVDCAAQCGAHFSGGDICWERGPLRGGSIWYLQLFCCDGGVVLEMLNMDDAWLRFVFVAALLCMRCRLPTHGGHFR